MKYKKFGQLVAVSALISPVVLSAQTAHAEETVSTTTNAEVASASINDIVSTTPAPSLESIAPSSESASESVPESSTTPPSSESGSTEESTTPEVIPHTIQKENSLNQNSNVFFKDGVKLTFHNGLEYEAGKKVDYKLEIDENYKINRAEIIGVSGFKEDLNKPSGEYSFSMPDEDITIYLELEKKPDQSSEENNSNNSNENNESSDEQKPEGSQDAEKQETPSGPTTPAGTPSDEKTPTDQQVPNISNNVQQAIVDEAYRHIGKPYVWGAKGPNAFDCSGLTYYVYMKATGHFIGGWTGTQQFAGAQIPVSSAQPGDLLFWGPATGVTHHVAIYVGNGMMIHAPQPGDVVKVVPVASFMPNFAVRVNVAGLPAASSSLQNAFGEYNASTESEQPFAFSKNQSTDQFLAKLAKDARKIGQDEDIYASVMLAQAILESGSGNSALASEPNYNLFGIKGKFNGQSVSFNTLEQDDQGKNYQIKADFRKYPSYKESMEDYAKLIKKGVSGNSEIYKGAWKSETSNYKEATKHLQGRYATDKQYASKLNAIIDAYDLTQYDGAETATVDGDTSSSVNGLISTAFGPNRVVFRDQLILTRAIKEEFSKADLKAVKEIFGPRPYKGLKKTYYVDLFRGDSIIALAAMHNKKQPLGKETLLADNTVVQLKGNMAAILPPIY